MVDRTLLDGKPQLPTHLIEDFRAGDLHRQRLMLRNLSAHLVLVRSRVLPYPARAFHHFPNLSLRSFHTRGSASRAQNLLHPKLRVPGVSIPKRSIWLSSLSNTVKAEVFPLGPIEEKQGWSKSFGETNHKHVAYWLLASATSVFGLVVFGGLTRLTESGYPSHRPLF